MIDSHCHFDDERFDGDRGKVAARAIAAGVSQLVVPATTRSSWSKIAELEVKGIQIQRAYGLHPMFMSQHEARDVDHLGEWIGQHNCVAIGECGLDFYIDEPQVEQQEALFKAQLKLAQELQLPVIVHARKALDRVLYHLRRYPGVRGVIHSFSGSLQQAQQLIDLGFMLGIAATVGFERAQKLRAVVAAVNAEALLLESDAPDQTGPEYRGQRNEPGFIAAHLAVIAELRQQSIGSMAHQLDKNATELFGLK